MKTIYKLAVGTVAGVVLASFWKDSIKSKVMNVDTDIRPPVHKVSIIVPTLNEEDFIERSLFSIQDQGIIRAYPHMFEIIVVDGGSTDNTIDKAKKYVSKITPTPKGKLTARNIATRVASGDIIVAVDADTEYPDGWLNTLLKPFYDETVVAVSGSTLDESIPLVFPLFSIIAGELGRLLNPIRLFGRNSAYLKSAFYLTGEFNEDIDQTDINSMLQEEEFGFGERMAAIGKVVQVINAPCIHLGGSKIGCRMGTEVADVCQVYGIGTERF